MLPPRGAGWTILWVAVALSVWSALYLLARFGPSGTALALSVVSGLAGKIRNSKSPTWHRKERRRRSIARRHIKQSRLNGNLKPSSKVRRALLLLSQHHSQPRYRELQVMVKQWNQNKQDWPDWSPGQWPKRRPAAKAKGDNHHKGVEAAVVTRPYDADGGSSTSAPSSSDGSQQAGMQEFFKEFMAMSKELGQPLPERLRKLVPNTDREELKEQQKRLNRLRTLRNRIEGKEKAIKQDEIQWEKWLKDIKESIVSQRQKHEEAQTRLAEELNQLRKEEEDLKNNREEEKEDFEADEEMDPEVMVDGLLAKEDQQKIKERNTKAEDALEVMQKNMEAQYQQRMMQERAQMSLEFQRMLQQALATQHAAQKPPEYVDLEVQDAAMGPGQKADATGTAKVEAQAAAVAERFSGMTKEETAKRALIPFGVARRDRTTRQPQSTSPYGRKAQEQDEEKDKEKNKEQTVEELMKAAIEQTTDATQQGQVPDPSRAPDTGQS